MRGLSMAQLSGKMQGQVSRQAICKYESGKMLPESGVLLSLARALGVKPDYFFRPFRVSLSGIAFRKNTSMSAKACKAVQQKVQDSVERYFEIEEICGLSHNSVRLSKVPTISTPEGVVLFAARIRQAWGLGFDGITDVISLLESRGVKVLEIQSEDAFDGQSGTVDGSFIIILNSSRLMPERKRFVALHELGHLMMHFDEGVSAKDKEALCDLFASEFLIPLDSFRNHLGAIGTGPVNLRTFAEIQRTYGISIDALMRKAHDAKMISDFRYKNYFARKQENLSYREYVEVVRTADESPHRFESLVLDAYARDMISVSKAASLLNCSVDKVIASAVVV